MPEQTATVILFASARRHGNTGKLVDHVAPLLDACVIDLGELSFSDFDYAHRNRHDDFERVMAQVLPCTEIVLASPIYWYGVAPPLKRFIDRLTDYLDLPELRDQGRQLRGKAASILCTSNHTEADPVFLGALQQTFAYLGMYYRGCLHLNCIDGFPSQSLEQAVPGFMQSFTAKHTHVAKLKGAHL